MEIRGSRILLTGATGGLGRAIAQRLAEMGGSLVLSSRRESELAELAAGLAGGGHQTVVTDLAEEGAHHGLLEAAGEVDILVANAALPASGRLDGYSEREIQRALRVNLEAPILLTHALLPGMTKRGRGHLVYVSSLSGKAPTARASLYSGTKFGLRGFSLALREDLRGTPVSASVVMPGTIRDAGMFADSGAKVPRGAGTSTPPEVADGVATAIERDRAEVAVAPLAQRFLAGFAARHPELAGRLGARAGVVDVAEAVASNQTDKR